MYSLNKLPQAVMFLIFTQEVTSNLERNIATLKRSWRYTWKHLRHNEFKVVNDTYNTYAVLNFEANMLS
jgi:hypothetical protein